MAVKIDRNIPAPPERKWGFLAKMEVGDSAFIQARSSDWRGASNVKNHPQTKGKVFISRKEKDGIRIWRQS